MPRPRAPDAAPEASLLLAAPPRPRWRVAVGAVVVLLLIGLGGAVVASLLAPRGGSVTVPASSPGTGAPGGAEEVLVVVVHVLGAVAEPGLYRLPEGSRVVDAVAAAGGFAPEAERGGLNLARRLVDAEQVVVPAIGETAASGAGPPGMTTDGRVNLNTADRAALETLPRVGPAMAERIIAWRAANGGFRAVEDLLQVSGIGDRTFEAMRELVST
ncbi:MAG: hypothetical protein BGO95_06665 [Micrococcales bacterium 73-13]|nr:MAG: hypothetical protein BGO95_06665 [Micrococcales bacterium 73-13]